MFGCALPEEIDHPCNVTRFWTTLLGRQYSFIHDDQHYSCYWDGKPKQRFMLQEEA